MMIIKGIGLDSSSKIAFQSHAHSDHFVSADIIISTRPTKFLSHLKKAGFYKTYSFERSFYIGEYKAKLYPAGHMLGSAQFYIKFDEFSLLYTGDVKWFKLRTAEKSKFRKADVLIIEATYGLPMYNFPTPKEAEKKLIAFVEEVLDRKKVPTLYATDLLLVVNGEGSNELTPRQGQGGLRGFTKAQYRRPFQPLWPGLRPITPTPRKSGEARGYLFHNLP